MKFVTWTLLILCFSVLYALYATRRIEGYALGTSDAALVCYWAPQPPPGAIPTRPDPRPSLAGDSPAFSDIKIPFATTSPMVQERSQKTIELNIGGAPALSGDIDKKAYVETTTAPPQILGTLPVAPTPPPSQTPTAVLAASTESTPAPIAS